MKITKPGRFRSLLRGWIYVLAVFAAAFGVQQKQVWADSGDVAQEVKNGVVGIQSGFVSSKDDFERLRSGSGFLISNKESRTYIITSRSVVENSENYKREYCDRKGLDPEKQNFEDEVRVVIKGDVLVEAEVLTQSKKKDYCILRIDSVLNDKSVLHLDDTDSLMGGEVIYGLGFPDPESGPEYTADDVEENYGIVESSSVMRGDLEYIQHTAEVTKWHVGGPLVNEKGYVVGVQCAKQEDQESGIYYAVSIDEIVELLDNFSLAYESSTKDKYTEEVTKLYKNAEQLCEDGDYKASSMEELKTAMETARQLFEQDEPTKEELKAAYDDLTNAKAALVKKVSKKTVAMWVLAVVILILLALLIWLLIRNYLDKKKSIKEAIGSAGGGWSYGTNGQGGMQMSPRQMPPVSMKPPADRNPYSLGGRQAQVQDFPPQEVPPPKPQPLMRLLWKRQGQLIEITKEAFVIGKNAGMSDFVVPDNPSVSRKHVMIRHSPDGRFVTDLGSANGTFVNDRRLRQGDYIRIRQGDEIRLADEVFVVK